MKHISIIVHERDSSQCNLEATSKMFNMVNDTFQKMGEEPMLETHLVGTHKKTTSNTVIEYLQ